MSPAAFWGRLLLLAALLGFTVPPVSYFLFLVAATLTYLALVEVVKRIVAGRRGLRAATPP